MVQYVVKDAFAARYRLADPRATLRDAAQAAVREVVGRMTIDDVLSKQRGQVSGESQELLQQILDDYDAGVTISSIELQEVHAPEPVRAAFDDVVGAAQDANRLVNEAEGYRNEVLPGARAEAVELTEAASGYREARVAEATGEAQRFVALQLEHQRAPQVTEKRLYLETMESVLPERREGRDRAGGGGAVALSPAAARSDGRQAVKRLILFALLALALVLGFIVAGSYDLGPVVVTREGEQKIILTLGSPRTVTQPGLALRVPLIETVRSYERRLLYLNAPPNAIQTRDQEGLVVDNYVAWRIANPVQFAAAFPAGRTQAEPQIDQVVRAAVREIVGQHTLADVVTGKRDEIMQVITEKTNRALGNFGIELEDVRINRTELPKGTEENVYARMKAERERQARKFRAEGGERARRIRAEADREARVIVANARRDAEIARGEGDAQAARIYAEAYATDPELYAFVRSLEAYRKTLGDAHHAGALAQVRVLPLPGSLAGRAVGFSAPPAASSSRSVRPGSGRDARRPAPRRRRAAARGRSRRAPRRRSRGRPRSCAACSRRRSRRFRAGPIRRGSGCARLRSRAAARAR